jgi:hypothetical protein
MGTLDVEETSRAESRIGGIIGREVSCRNKRCEEVAFAGRFVMKFGRRF